LRISYPKTGTHRRIKSDDRLLRDHARTRCRDCAARLVGGICDWRVLREAA
jgi:hypothetical protein